MSTLSRDHIDELMKLEGISTKERDAYLGGYQASLFPDNQRVEVFMLVIHNDRVDALQAIEGLFKTVYPFRLTVFENSLNSRNTAQIWNKLTSESKSEYIMFIDSDCFPQNDIITAMAEVLNIYPNVAAVGPTGGGSLPAHHLVKELTVINNHLSGCCFMFRKSFWEHMKFDEDFIFYGQDSDWAQRILESEYEMMVTPDAQVIHGDSVSASKLKDQGLFNPGMDSYIARKLYERKMNDRDRFKREAQELEAHRKGNL